MVYKANHKLIWEEARIKEGNRIGGKTAKLDSCSRFKKTSVTESDSYLQEFFMNKAMPYFYASIFFLWSPPENGALNHQQTVDI